MNTDKIGVTFLTDTTTYIFDPYLRPIFGGLNEYGIYPSIRFYPLFEPLKAWLPFGDVPFTVILSKYEDLYVQLINITTISGIDEGDVKVSSSIHTSVTSNFGEQTILRKKRGRLYKLYIDT